MFDYQAGEKYKLTLIMVAVAGIMAGIFFTVLLMPTPQPRHARPRAAHADHPDVTGRAVLPSGYGAGAAQALPSAPSGYAKTDPLTAQSLIEQWLPLAWDLSAGSSQASQNKAMAYMTAECAAAYKQNIWTPDLAKQIEEAGLKSSFKAENIRVGGENPDGAVVILVEGVQSLGVPGGNSNARRVKLEYLVKQTPQGLRIAGISEGS